MASNPGAGWTLVTLSGMMPRGRESQSWTGGRGGGQVTPGSCLSGVTPHSSSSTNVKGSSQETKVSPALQAQNWVHGQILPGNTHRTSPSKTPSFRPSVWGPHGLGVTSPMRAHRGARQHPRGRLERTFHILHPERLPFTSKCCVYFTERGRRPLSPRLPCARGPRGEHRHPEPTKQERAARAWGGGGGPPGSGCPRPHPPLLQESGEGEPAGGLRLISPAPAGRGARRCEGPAMTFVPQIRKRNPPEVR